MLRIVVKRAVMGTVIVDTVASESLVNQIAQRFRDSKSFIVHISYP